MYKKLILAAAVVATLAGCAKSEINPVVEPDLEITYQAVLNPRTKAGELVFNTNNVFQSFAYYLPKGKTWTDNKADASSFINGATISYNSTDNVWKDASNAYYWPKKGSLTFLSWTLDKNTLEGATVTCDKNEGIKVDGFDVSEHQDTLMVAEVAANKTANESFNNFTGVPTLFKHKLCKVKCIVAADENNPAGTVITVNSLTFGDIVKKGTYVQLPVDKWTLSEVADDKEIVTFTFADNEIAVSEKTVSNVPLFIPQSFTERNIITLEYSVKDNAGITTDYTQTVALNNENIFKTGWEQNKYYTLTITIKLDEILWAPGVEDWTVATAGSWTVE